MNKLQLTCATLAVLLPAATTADSTALRTGLWELTFKSDLTLQQARRLSTKTPQVWLAQIPASQRSELEKQYRSGELLRNALNAASTVCITEDELERGIRPGTDLDGPCLVSNVSTHPTWQQLQLICAGLGDEPQGKAAIDIAVTAPTTFTGKLIRTLAASEKPFSVTVELHGTWLDSQCGEEAQEEDEAALR